MHQIPSSLIVDSVTLDSYGNWSSVFPKASLQGDREQAVNRKRKKRY